MLQQLPVLLQERIVNIRDIQRHPSRALQGITRVVKNGQMIGLFLDEAALADLAEDLEALASTRYLATIAQADKQIRSKQIVSFNSLKKKYGI